MLSFIHFQERNNIFHNLFNNVIGIIIFTIFLYQLSWWFFIGFHMDLSLTPHYHLLLTTYHFNNCEIYCEFRPFAILFFTIVVVFKKRKFCYNLLWLEHQFHLGLVLTLLLLCTQTHANKKNEGLLVKFHFIQYIT